jgi:hypothetical protein
MSKVTYFSLLPDELLFELLVNVLSSDNQSTGNIINMIGVNSFVESIPRLFVILANKKNVSILIDKYTHTLDIVRILKYEYFLDVKTYLKIFYMLYVNVTLDYYKEYVNSGDYMLPNSDMVPEEDPIRIELDPLNQITYTIKNLHKIKIKFKYFYKDFIESGMIESLTNIGEGIYYYNPLYSILEELYEDYIGTRKLIYSSYYTKTTKDYIFTGSIPHGYKVPELKFLAELYDNYTDLIILNIILLSDKVNLEIQDDEYLFDNLIFLIAMRYNHAFIKFKEKLSYNKRVLIINAYNLRLENGRYSGEPLERLVYYNEILEELLR